MEISIRTSFLVKLTNERLKSSSSSRGKSSFVWERKFHQGNWFDDNCREAIAFFFSIGVSFRKSIRRNNKIEMIFTRHRRPLIFTHWWDWLFKFPLPKNRRMHKPIRTFFYFLFSTLMLHHTISITHWFGPSLIEAYRFRGSMKYRVFILVKRRGHRSLKIIFWKTQKKLIHRWHVWFGEDVLIVQADACSSIKPQSLLESLAVIEYQLQPNWQIKGLVLRIQFKSDWTFHSAWHQTWLVQKKALSFLFSPSLVIFLSDWNSN